MLCVPGLTVQSPKLEREWTPQYPVDPKSQMQWTDIAHVHCQDSRWVQKQK